MKGEFIIIVAQSKIDWTESHCIIKSVTGFHFTVKFFGRDKNMDLKEVSEIENKFIEFELDYIRQTPTRYKNIERDDLRRLGIFSLENLYKALLRNRGFDKREIEKILIMAVGIKLEYYAIILDIKLYPFIEFEDARDYNKKSFLLYSQQQSIVLKTGVLWERLLNLIYFIIFHNELSGNTHLDEEVTYTHENGKRIKTITKRRSKKRYFFDKIRELGKEKKPWKFMLDYENILKIYEDKFVNPEKHKYSPLVKYCTTDKTIDPNKLLRNLNQATNAIWPNICSILERKVAPCRFQDEWQIHVKEF